MSSCTLRSAGYRCAARLRRPGAEHGLPSGDAMSILKRAVIKAYNAGTHRASVQMAESLSVWLDGLVVATDIAAADVVPGRDCTVLLFTDDNPDDGVIVTVHGALPSAPAAGAQHLPRDLNTTED